MVRLRRLSPEDVPAITALLQDDYEGVMQTSRMGWPFRESEAASFVERAIAESETAWAVEEEASGALAGGIGATQSEPVEIGYWIGKPFRGRGFATEAIRLLLVHLRAAGVTKVQAQVFVENPASARVLQKSGFVYQTEVEHDMPLRGGLRRLHVYGLDLPTFPS